MILCLKRNWRRSLSTTKSPLSLSLFPHIKVRVGKERERDGEGERKSGGRIYVMARCPHGAPYGDRERDGEGERKSVMYRKRREGRGEPYESIVYLAGPYMCIASTFPLSLPISLFPFPHTVQYGAPYICCVVRYFRDAFSIPKSVAIKRKVDDLSYPESFLIKKFDRYLIDI